MGGSAGLDEEIEEAWDRFAPAPVALKLAEHLHRGDQLAACLLDAPQRGSVRGG